MNVTLCPNVSGSAQTHRAATGVPAHLVPGWSMAFLVKVSPLTASENRLLMFKVFVVIQWLACLPVWYPWVHLYFEAGFLKKKKFYMVFHACPVCLVPGESPGNKVILTSSPIKCLLVYEKMMLIPWVSKAGVENVWPTDLIRLPRC